MRQNNPFASWLIVLLTALVSIFAPATMNYAEDSETPPVGLPDWLHKTSWSDGDTDFVVVQTEGFLQETEAWLVLHDRVDEAITVQANAMSEDAPMVVTRADLHTPALVEELVFDSQTLQLSTPDGGLRHFGFALLRLDDDFRKCVARLHHNAIQTRRLIQSGVVGFIGFGWLCVIYAALKTDLLTRHFYTRRLQSVALLMMIAILSVGVAAWWLLSDIQLH